MTRFWLSFYDPRRSGQSRFLGVAVVDVDGDTGAALREAFLKGCNPGGQAFASILPDDMRVPSSFMNRILSWDEATALANGGVQ